MQQLSQWRVDEVAGQITLDEPFYLIEDRFVDRAQSWVEALEASLVSVETGADRAQIHFRTHQHDWVLYVELLCEAAWVEPMGKVPPSQLHWLHDLLSAHTFV